jgi:hypothetical protein
VEILVILEALLSVLTCNVLQSHMVNGVAISPRAYDKNTSGSLFVRRLVINGMLGGDILTSTPFLITIDAWVVFSAGSCFMACFSRSGLLPLAITQPV